MSRRCIKGNGEGENVRRGEGRFFAAAADNRDESRSLSSFVVHGISPRVKTVTPRP